MGGETSRINTHGYQVKLGDDFYLRLRWGYEFNSISET